MNFRDILGGNREVGVGLSARPLDGSSITVVGAGVLGSATAVLLANLGADVRMVADKTKGTISHSVNGGLLEPYASFDPRNPRWFGETLQAVLGLAQGALGPWVQERGGLLFSAERSRVLPPWRDEVLAFRHPAPSPRPMQYPHASWYQTLTLRPDHLLETLHFLARKAGVTFQTGVVHSLRELVRSERPDAVVAAAGLGMAELWPDPSLDAGVGLVYVVDLPPPGTEPWLERQAFMDGGIDLRRTILMNQDLPAYSIPRPADPPSRTQVVIGGTVELRRPGDPIGVDAQLVEEHRRNVEAGLPPVFQEILDRLQGRWRVGGRPMRPVVMIDIKTVEGIPVLGLGGVGGSGISIFAGVVGDGLQLLLDALGRPPSPLTPKEILEQPGPLHPAQQRHAAAQREAEQGGRPDATHDDEVQDPPSDGDRCRP